VGKQTRVFHIFAVVLLYQLIIIPSTSAGFFDWRTDKKEKAGLLVQISQEQKASSDNFYRWTKLLQNKAQEIEPKVEYKVIHETVRQVTAYNVGDPYQTDSTPCIGAYPKVDLCEEVAKGIQVCAANFVPLNTILRIINDTGESFECIVWDRMNSRYTKRVDIAMDLIQKAEAKKFGVNEWKVQILKEENSI